MKNLIFLIVLNCILNINISTNIVYSGNSSNNSIYLTFDDGYSLKNTTKIFEICEDNKVPVTFFFHGDFLSNCPIIVNKIAHSNYGSISSHTYSHKNITTMSSDELEKDLLKYEDTYYKATSLKINKYFRPPMGKYDNYSKKVLDKLGYKIIMWNVCYYDYNYQDDKGYSFAMKNLKKQTKAGSIILMHTMTNSNVEVLEDFINYARGKGFKFKSISEL